MQHKLTMKNRDRQVSNYIWGLNSIPLINDLKKKTENQQGYTKVEQTYQIT